MNQFKLGVKKFSNDLTFLIGFLLLSITYFFGVFLTFSLANIFKKRFLDSHKKETYWKELDLNSKELNDYYHQF